jgi:predicted PurR-regulated permease PerM
MDEFKKIDISVNTIFKTILILLALWFLYLIRDIVLLLFIAVVIVSAIDPAVDFLKRKKIPRPVGTLLLFLALAALIALAISFLVPPMVKQFHDFSQNIPKYYSSAENSLNSAGNFLAAQNINIGIGQITNDIGSFFGGLPQNIFSRTVGIFSGLISTIVVLAMAFYMSVEEKGVKKFIVSVTPEGHKEYAASVTDRIESKIGKWMLGQLVLMVIIFILDFIGLSLIGLPYALILAFIAGLLEIVPYVGPIVSAIPGIIIGLSISPLMGFLVFIIYLAAQQFETNVVVPQVMKKAVGLNPVATILAILTGFKLAGVLGAIIAIPVATAVSVFVSDLMEKK